MIARTTALNQRTRYHYNPDHNLTDVTNALDQVMQYTYDVRHRNTRVEDPLGHQTEYGYDTNHHPVSERMDTGTGTILTSSTAYQSNGLVLSRTDPNGTATTFTYDQYGRTHTQKTSDHPLIDWDYDALGRLTQITDQAGAKTQFKYDARGKPTEIIDPLGRSTRMGYDDAGRLDTLTDRNGETSALTYTASSQIQQVDYPGTAEDVSFSYDQRDQVKQMVDGLGTHNYQYDDLGRLISQTDAHGFTVGYGYDGHGNLTRLTYPGDQVVTYGYDALNRLKTVTDWLNQTTTYHYDAAGRLTHQAHGNGTRTRYRYDDANRLLEQKNEQRDQTPITTQTFTLDANGNRLTEQRTQPQAPSETAVDVSYQYNLKKTRLQSVTDETTNTQIETFQYDNEGQQTEKSGQSYGFDSRHRLVNQGNRVYHYDATNNRLRVETAGQTNYLIYDKGNNLLAEANANKQITRYYIHGAGLLSMIQNQASYQYHFSATGHTLAMTDSNQQVVNQYAYGPYGRILGASETAGLEQPFKYVGQYGVQHEGGHLYYMRARYYDADTGRFIKEDPIGISGGLNVYLYANGNPVAFVDPSGNYGVWGGLYGAVAGGVGGYITGGWEGAALGALAGGAVGFVAPYQSHAAGTATAAGYASVAGQAAGIYTSTGDLSELKDVSNYNPGAVGGAMLGGAIGGPINNGISRLAYRPKVIGSTPGKKLVTGHSKTLGAVTEGAAVGVGGSFGNGGGPCNW